VISLAGVLRALKTLIGIGETASEVIDLAGKALDPEPRVKGQPLSYRDVEHQRRQAASAARAFPPPSSPPPDTPTQPAVPRQMPGRKARRTD
jgi:hypothetical protein